MSSLASQFREELLLLLRGVVVVIFVTGIVFVVAAVAGDITVVVLVGTAVVEKYRGCLGQRSNASCAERD